MGMIGRGIRTAAVAAAINFVQREARKPENQRKAKELLTRVSRRGAGVRSGRTAPRGH